MKKGAFFFGIALILFSIILQAMHVMQPVLLVIKYCTLCIGISMTSYAFIRPHIKRSYMILALVGYVFILFFIILTLDTFLFHAITWFPGILRYPIYSLYGIPYLIFILPGWLICYHDERGNLK